MNKINDYDKKYISDREQELVSNMPGVITVEDYCKWYNLFYISEDGIVHKLHELYKDAFNIEGVDHYYYPSSVVEFALKHNLKIEYISYAAICHRYMEDSEVYEIPKEHLPKSNDLEKVLIDSSDYRSKSYCDYFYLYPKYFTYEMCLENYSISMDDRLTDEDIKQLFEIKKPIITERDTELFNVYLKSIGLKIEKEVK